MHLVCGTAAAMSLAFRGLWVLSCVTPDAADMRVLYGKRFMCCDTLCSGMQQQPLPESDAEVAALIAARRHKMLLSSGAFALLQPPVSHPPPSPYPSPPVCFMCAHSLTIACVPVCPDVTCALDGSIMDACAAPVLTAAIWFLHLFSDSLTSLHLAATATATSGDAHVADFVSKLAAALPMGRPSAFCEGACAAACAAGKGFVPQSSFSWRPVAPARAKKRLELKLRETVCAHLYSRSDKPDVVTCSGSIICNADVDGSPDITLTIKNARALTHVRAHACAQRPEISNGDFTLSFSPPMDRFVLARYTVDCSCLPDAGLPFTCEYEALAQPDGSAALCLSLQSTAAGAAGAGLQLRAVLPLQGWGGGGRRRNF